MAQLFVKIKLNYFGRRVLNQPLYDRSPSRESTDVWVHLLWWCKRDRAINRRAITQAASQQSLASCLISTYIHYPVISMPSRHLYDHVVINTGLVNMCHVCPHGRFTSSILKHGQRNSCTQTDFKWH
jgi:hypothetical protein